MRKKQWAFSFLLVSVGLVLLTLALKSSPYSDSEQSFYDLVEVFFELSFWVIGIPLLIILSYKLIIDRKTKKNK